MFEHFTEPARHVVVVSQEVAAELDHAEIGAAHFLVALRQEPDPRLIEVWAGIDPPSEDPSAGGPRAGLTVAGLRAVAGTGSGSETGHVPFTTSGKATFEHALRAGATLGTSPTISTLELLLGVLDTKDKVSAALLAAAGVDRTALRARAAAAANKPSPA